MPRSSIIIAIDGPVASGKTSVGKLLSRELQYRFLDTGIMYRAITWLALDRRIDVTAEDALGRLAWETVIRLKEGEGADGVVLINGREVSEELRQPDVERSVSLVSMVPEVRTALVAQQREIAQEGRIVVVGRDIGTVVLPDADLKLYLSASVSERARRRHAELMHKGRSVEYEQVLNDLEARDKLDTGRDHSPLRPAHNAVMLETEGMDLEQVTKAVLELLEGDSWP